MKNRVQVTAKYSRRIKQKGWKVDIKNSSRLVIKIKKNKYVISFWESRVMILMPNFRENIREATAVYKYKCTFR